jgi:hypothetical protein
VKLSSVALCCSCLLLAVGCSSEQTEKTVGADQSRIIATNSTCPDDSKLELSECQFVKIKSVLTANLNARERYRTASDHCGAYDQTTINFCLGSLRNEAEVELIEAYGTAKPSPTVASYLEWKSRIEQICTPDYPPEEGGSGYSSRVTFCELTKYSEKIDSLSGSLKRK